MGKKENKKRSPKEIIESEKDSSVEHSYIKFPKQEIVPTSEFSYEDIVFRDTKKIERLYKESGGKKYLEIHTHTPRHYDDLWSNFWASPTTILPSYGDFRLFLGKKMRGILIAQIEKNGEVAGYLYLRKPANFKEIDLEHRKNIEERYDEKYAYDNSIKRSFHKFVKRYGIKYRFIPAKGFKLDWMGRGFVRMKRKQEAGSLEKKVTVIMGLSFIASILFLSSNITGFAIANLTQKTLNTIGVILFIIGLIGAFYYFRRKGEK